MDNGSLSPPLFKSLELDMAIDRISHARLCTNEWPSRMSVTLLATSDLCIET